MDKKDHDEINPSLLLAGEEGVNQNFSGLPGRLVRYGAFHSRALDMADYIAKQPDCKRNSSKAKGLITCGDYLHFRDYYTVDQLRLYRADFCKQHLLCPLCALRRGAKFVQAYMEKVALVIEAEPSIKPYLVTLTVKDGPDLKERYSHLHKSHSKMVKHRMNAMKSRHKEIEMSKALGGVASYEFKKGAGSGQWHPHIHAVWLCIDAPDQSKLQEEWKGVTQDSHIVDVTPFHDDPVKGFLEVGRYALKFSDMTIPDNWEAAGTLAGKRLIQSFGILLGIKIPKELTDEPLEGLPFVDRLYSYHRAISGYNFIPARNEKEIWEHIANKSGVKMNY